MKQQTFHEYWKAKLLHPELWQRAQPHCAWQVRRELTAACRSQAYRQTWLAGLWLARAELPVALRPRFCRQDCHPVAPIWLPCLSKSAPTTHIRRPSATAHQFCARFQLAQHTTLQQHTRNTRDKQALTQHETLPSLSLPHSRAQTRQCSTSRATGLSSTSSACCRVARPLAKSNVHQSTENIPHTTFSNCEWPTKVSVALAQRSVILCFCVSVKACVTRKLDIDSVPTNTKIQACLFCLPDEHRRQRPQLCLRCP